MTDIKIEIKWKQKVDLLSKLSLKYLIIFVSNF